MTKIVRSITEVVGNTPLLELVNYQEKYDLKARVLVKLEFLNASGSVKARPVINMLEEAEKRGDIKPGDTIVDSTSGNTGISLASFCAAKGYKLVLILDDNVTLERSQILRAFGVELHYYSDFPEIVEMQEKGELSYPEVERLLTDLASENGWYYICQINNPDNPQIHYEQTGPEIWDQAGHEVDYFVSMAGTGGTLAGVGQYLREQNPAVQIIGVQAAPESIRTPDNPDAPIIDGTEPFHDLEGIGPLFVKRDSYDELIEYTTEEAYQVAQNLAQIEGLFLGTSAAANIGAALDLAHRPENAGKTIVTLAPDDGLKYLSTDMFK